MDEAKPFGAYAPAGFARWAIETTRSFPDTWLARRTVILIRRLVMWRLRGEPVDIEALGARMRVRPYNNICEKRVLFTPQSFDATERAILAAHFRPGFTFIDIGANVGAYSLFVAANAGPTARVLAIEPQPGIFDRLVTNIRLNAFSNIKAIACAVADKPGDLTLFIDARNSGESSVKIVAAGGAEPIRVPGKTLLEIVHDEGFARIDAIKLDIEGAEDIVLEPFLKDAAKALLPPLIILENGTGQWLIDLPGLLARHGYRERARTRLNLVFERPADNDRATGDPA